MTNLALQELIVHAKKARLDATFDKAKMNLANIGTGLWFNELQQ